MPNILEAIGIIFISILGLILAENIRWRRAQGAGIVGILYGIYLILANIWVGVSTIFSPLPTSTLPPTPTRIPNSISLTRAAGIQTGETCTHWSEINQQNKGEKICIYGTIYQIYSTKETYTRIKFTDERNSFFLYSINYEFFDKTTGEILTAGDCITFTGTVASIEHIPYMDIGENSLRYCETWMEGK